VYSPYYGDLALVRYLADPVSPPSVTCPATLTHGCDAPVEVTDRVADSDGDALTVVWKVNGQMVELLSLPATNRPNAVPVSLHVQLPLGTNVVSLSVTDNTTNTAVCSTEVVIMDKTPPKITCPSNIVATNEPGRCWASIAFEVSATDDCGPTQLSCDMPSGSAFPVGTTAVTCTAIDASSNLAVCTFSSTVRDNEGPLVACRPAPNPAGRKTPGSGKNSSDIENPDGYYQLLAKDNCDPAPGIYIRDSASTFVAGPFASGDIVKLIGNPGGAPFSEPGVRAVIAKIHLKGDALVYATDAPGNVSAQPCVATLPAQSNSLYYFQSTYGSRR